MECFPFSGRRRGCPRRNTDPLGDFLSGYVSDPLVGTAIQTEFQRADVGLWYSDRRPVAILKEPYLTSGRFVVDKLLSDDMFPTWKTLEELVDKGKIKNIGVCKYVLWDTFVYCPITADSPEASQFGGSNNL